MKTTYFFRDKPLFGIDIGSNTVRVMQASPKSGQFLVKGYGSGTFDPKAVKDGVVLNPEVIAQTIKQALSHGIQGSITARRVAMSIPASRTFSRAMNMPKLADKELRDAVRLETEQYTPIAIDSLYLDYTTINQSATELELFAVAAPKQVVDSYLQVAKLLDLEPVLVETRVDSAHRLFAMTEFGNIPSVLIDFDQGSVDISIIDKSVIASGTVSLGSRVDANNPASPSTAARQVSGSALINPQLELLVKEVRRMVRYYQERYDKTHQIEQIVLFGDGTTLPGLAGLMTDQLRLPVRSADPWPLFKYNSELSPIPSNLSGDYIIAAGLAVVPFSQVLA